MIGYLCGLQQTEAFTAAILANRELVDCATACDNFSGHRSTDSKRLSTNQKVLKMVLQFRAGHVIIVSSMLMSAVDNRISTQLASRLTPAKISTVKSFATALVLVAISLTLGYGSMITNLKSSLYLLMAGMRIEA